MKPELARRAKAFAKKTDRTFTELVEEAIKNLIDEGTKSPSNLSKLTVAGGHTVISLADLEKSIRAMDREDDLRKLG